MGSSEQAVPLQILEVRLREIDLEISRLKKRSALLRAEKETIRRLRAQAIPVTANGAQPDAEAPTPKDADRTNKGPTEAILDLVGREPGLRPVEIVDRLEQTIRSKSTNRRKMLFTLIGSLKGEQLDEREGLVYPKSEEGIDEDG